MANNISNAAGLLKQFYGPKMANQLNRVWMTHNLLSKKTAKNGGSGAIIPLQLQGNNGVSAIADGGTLPTAGYQTVVKATVPYKYIYGSIALTDPVLEAAATDKGAFKDALDLETQGIVEDMKNQIGRMTFGDGTGKVALVNVAGGLSSGTALVFDGAIHRRPFEVGDRISVYTANLATKQIDGTTVTASAVTYTSDTAGTITLSASSSCDDDAIIMIGSNPYTAGTGCNEFVDGLNAAIGGDTNYGQTTFQSVSGSTYSNWQSSIVDGSTYNAGDPSSEHFEVAQDTVELNSGKVPDCIVTTHGVRRMYIQTLEDQKRYMTNDLVGGWEAIAFQGGNAQIPIYADRWCTPQTAYGFRKEDVKVFRLADFSWMDRDGSMLSRAATTATYNATYRYYADLGWSRRNTAFRIHSLNES
jgi:hypothetical protein